MTIIGIGFCLLMLAAMFAVQVVLPILLLVKLGKFLWRYFHKGQPGAEEPRQPARSLQEVFPAARPSAPGQADELERAKAEAEAARAEAAAAKAEAGALREAAEWRRRQEARISEVKAQARLNRIALVYYVEDSLKSGVKPEAIAAALRTKGWPEEEILGALPQSAS